MQFRKTLEEPTSDLFEIRESIIECPGLADVIFRPGQSSICHPGNMNFRSLVESKHYEHSVAATREGKVDITKGVLQEIRSMGGKFLVWDHRNFWVELEDEKKIYAKIAIFFRNSKVSVKAKKNCQSIRGGTFAFAGDADKRRKIDDDDDTGPCFSPDLWSSFTFL